MKNSIYNVLTTAHGTDILKTDGARSISENPVSPGRKEGGRTAGNSIPCTGGGAHQPGRCGLGMSAISGRCLGRVEPTRDYDS